MSVKKAILVTVGCMTLGLGCVGIVLPILPTVPFFLITLYCFSASSERLHSWFIGTKLYKNHLESYVQKRGMTMKTKLTIIGMVTALMTVGFILMSKAPIGRIVLVVVWVCHLAYFLLIVKTIRNEGSLGLQKVRSAN